MSEPTLPFHAAAALAPPAGSLASDAPARHPAPTSWRARVRWIRALLLRPRWTAVVTRTTELVLEANVTRAVLVGELPFSVSCAAGCVWVTHEGDTSDHVLEPGDAFSPTTRGLLVATTFAPSRLVLAHSGRGASALVLV